MVYRGGFQTASNRFKNRLKFIYWGGYITASIDKIFKKKKNLFLKVVYWGGLKTTSIDHITYKGGYIWYLEAVLKTASIDFSIDAIFENRLYRAFMSIEAVLIKALLKFLEAVL